MSITNQDEKKNNQAELRRLQREKDKGKTFGNDDKNPCKQEQALSLNCIQNNYSDQQNSCQVYFDNYKSCLEFWSAVKEYRLKYEKNRQLPNAEERSVYKKQLKTWLLTKKIVNPDKFESKE